MGLIGDPRDTATPTHSFCFTKQKHLRDKLQASRAPTCVQQTEWLVDAELQTHIKISLGDQEMCNPHFPITPNNRSHYKLCPNNILYYI